MEEIIFEQQTPEEPAELPETPETAPEEETLPLEAELPAEVAVSAEAELAAHVEEMSIRFPDVDIIKLEDNSAFRRFAGSRYGKESLADLYESYTRLVNEAEAAAKAKSYAKASRATGGSSGKSGSALNTAQRDALRRWNESNPDMKMTEKEFLLRG